MRLRLLFVLVFAALLAWALGCGQRPPGEGPGPLPTATPTAPATATPGPTATPTPGETPTPTPAPGTPTATPTPGGTPGATPTPGGTPGLTPTPAGQRPRATLSAIPTQGMQPLDVTFTGSGTDDGQIVSYTLDYGDQTTPYSAATAPSRVVHRYLVPGQYVATLTVTDNESLTGSATVRITVTAQPPETGDVGLIIE